MQGFRTILFNLLGPLFAWLATKGLALDAEQQLAVVTVIMAAGNLVLRWVTTTPIGQKALNQVALLLAIGVSLPLAACTHPETRPTMEPAAFQAMLGDVQEVIVDRNCRDVTLPAPVAKGWCR